MPKTGQPQRYLVFQQNVKNTDSILSLVLEIVNSQRNGDMAPEEIYNTSYLRASDGCEKNT